PPEADSLRNLFSFKLRGNLRNHIGINACADIVIGFHLKKIACAVNEFSTSSLRAVVLAIETQLLSISGVVDINTSKRVACTKSFG
ncbi:MAG TPA: hypothetical protein VJY62_00865, partial [Bacteroidia bacterium]|nr:hypothetical protein [Bacteroidia bacterium]